MKNNKCLIAIIIILFLIIIGLLSYIIFERKYENKKTANNVTTITTTNNQTTTLYSGDSNGEFNLKIQKNKVYSNGLDYEINYDNINFSNPKTKYNIITNENKVSVEYIDGANTFKIGGKEIGRIESPELYLLVSLKQYNNYLVVALGCACDIPSRTFAIDLNNNKVIEDVCFPDDKGKCTDYSYKYENEDFIETEYSLDYTNKVNKYIINKEIVDCNKYSEYQEAGCGNNKECERRFPRCFGP